MALLEQVKAVLVEYAQYLPLTLRQVFYRLVGAYGYDKTEQAYARLGEALNRARRAEMIPWSSIRDDGFSLVIPPHSISPENDADWFIHGLRNFRLDRQEGQPRRLLFAVEAAGMLPQITSICAPYGIAAYPAGGFDSSTVKHDLAERLDDWDAAELLHIGDHDPSGVHLFKNLAEDVAEFASMADIVFTRLAVTPQQIAALGLPTAPPKATDRRSFEGETTQAEAIPPDVLAAIVTQAIESRVDRDAFDLVIEEELAVQRMTPQEIADLVLQRAQAGH